MPADTLTRALCAAITALLDDAEVALEGEHYEGALERVLQAEAVLHMAREAAGGLLEAELLTLNKRIEEVAQAGAELAADLDEATTTTAQEYV